MRFSSQVSSPTNWPLRTKVFLVEATQIFLTSSCFVLDNSYNWTHRQQLEFAEHRDMILSGIYLFNKTWKQKLEM